MDVAGLVVVEVRTDLKPLEQGLAEAKQKAQQLEKELSGAFKGPTEAAKQFGDSIASSLGRSQNGGFQWVSREAAEAQSSLKNTAQAAQTTGTALSVAGAAARVAGNDIGTAATAARAAGSSLKEASDHAKGTGDSLRVAAVGWERYSSGAKAAGEGLKTAGDQARDAGQAAAAAGAAAAGAGGGFNNMGDAARNAAANTVNMASAMRLLGVAMTALLAIASTLAIALGTAFTAEKFLTETINAEKEQQRLAAALQSTGNAAQQSVAGLNAHADALKESTGLAGGAISTVQALLLSFNQIRGDTFQRATESAIDMAAAMGTDLSSAAQRVGRALQDPITATSMLSRSGIRFSEGQRRLIRDLVETGEVAKAQDIILRELEQRYDGMAEAARDTLGGALRALGNAWNDVFTLGPSAIDPLRAAVEGLITAIKDPAFTAFVQLVGNALMQAMATGVGGITLMVNAVGTLRNAMDDIAVAATTLGVQLAILFAPAAITAFTTAITTGFTIIGTAGAAAFTLIGNAIRATPIGAVITAITLVVTALYVFRDRIKEVFGVDLFGVIESAANMVIGSFRAAFADLVFVWNQFPNILEASIVGAANKVIGAIEFMVNKSIEGINRLKEGLNSALPGDPFTPSGPTTLDRLENPAAVDLAKANEAHIENIKRITSTNYLGGVTQSTAEAKKATEDFGQSVNDTAKVFDIANEKLGGLSATTATAARGMSTAAGSLNAVGTSVEQIVRPHHDALVALVSMQDQLQQTETELKRYQFAVEEASTLKVADVMGDADELKAAAGALEVGRSKVMELFAEFDRGDISLQAFRRGVEGVKDSMEAVAGSGNAVDGFIDGLVKALLQSARLETQVDSLGRAINNIPNRVIDITIREHTVRTSTGGSAQIGVQGLNPNPIVKNDGSDPLGVSGSMSLYPGGTALDLKQSGVNVSRGGGVVGSNLSNTLQTGVIVTPATINVQEQLSNNAARGFAGGGFTGHQPTDQVAGFVHGQEYVFDAPTTARIGVQNLDAIRSGMSGFQSGGYVASVAWMAPTVAMAAAPIVVPGYASGGFTGHSPTDQVAGFVHGQEYVFDAPTTSRIGVANLDAIRAGVSGFQTGGVVDPLQAFFDRRSQPTGYDTLMKLSTGDPSQASPNDFGMREASMMAVDHSIANEKEKAKYGWFDVPVTRTAPTSSPTTTPTQSAVEEEKKEKPRTGFASGSASSRGEGLYRGFYKGREYFYYDYHDPKAPYHYRSHTNVGGAVYSPLSDFLYNGNYGALSILASMPMDMMYTAPRFLSGNPDNYKTNADIAEQLAKNGPQMGTYGGGYTFSALDTSDFATNTGFFSGSMDRLSRGGAGVGQQNIYNTSPAPSTSQQLAAEAAAARKTIATYGFDTGGMIHPGDSQKVEFFKRPDETVIIVRPDQLRDERTKPSPAAEAAATPAVPADPGVAPATPAVPAMPAAQREARGASPAIPATPASHDAAAVPAVPAMPASGAAAMPSAPTVLERAAPLPISMSMDLDALRRRPDAAAASTPPVSVSRSVHFNIPGITIVSPDPISDETATEAADRLRSEMMMQGETL